jgi:hypothetical protein
MIFGFVISMSKLCNLMSCTQTCKEWKEMALRLYLWKPILCHCLGCHSTQLQLTLHGFQTDDDIIDLVADPWAMAKQTFQCYLCQGPAEHTPCMTTCNFYHQLARATQSNLVNCIWLFAPRHRPGSYVKDGMPWVKCQCGMPAVGNHLWRSIVISTWMNCCCNL